MDLAVPLSRRSAELARLPAPEYPGADRATVAEEGRRGAAAALDRGETHYTDRPGLPALRRAVAQRLDSAYAWPTAAGDVVITCGVTEARFVAIQKMLASGEGAVWAVEHAERIAGPCRIRGVDVVRSYDELPQGPVVVYVPSDGDPERRARALAHAEERGWTVLAEVGGLVGPEALLGELTGRRAHVYAIGDLAAPQGAAAWRVGFLATPADAVGPLKEFKQALTLCTTNVSQWGVLALLEGSA